jgi:hypothetical protein
MTVFIGFLMSTVLVGIFMRHRPFYQSQLLILLLIAITAIGYFVFGMI